MGRERNLVILEGLLVGLAVAILTLWAGQNALAALVAGLLATMIVYGVLRWWAGPVSLLILAVSSLAIILASLGQAAGYLPNPQQFAPVLAKLPHPPLWATGLLIGWLLSLVLAARLSRSLQGDHRAPSGSRLERLRPKAGLTERTGQVAALQAELNAANSKLKHWHLDGIQGAVLQVVVNHARSRQMRFQWDEFAQLAGWVIWMEQNRLSKPYTDVRENKKEGQRLSLSLVVKDSSHREMGLGEIVRGPDDVDPVRDIQALIRDAWEEVHEREQFRELRPR